MQRNCDCQTYQRLNRNAANLTKGLLLVIIHKVQQTTSLGCGGTVIRNWWITVMAIYRLACLSLMALLHVYL